MERGIKAVIFDVGGVLQLGEKQRRFAGQKHASGVHELIARKLKIDLDQYFDAIDTAYVKSIEGQITEKKLISTLSKNLNIPRAKIGQLYQDIYKRKFSLNKRLLNHALKLKKAGYKISILSDQWSLSKRALLPKDQFKAFRPIVVSCEVGVRKPNPEIYELALKKLKLNPHEAVFIDNQIWNTNPAKKMGMKTIIFSNTLQTIKALEKLGVKI